MTQAKSETVSDSSPELLPTARDNIERLTAFQDQEDAEISRLQAVIESVSRFFGSSAYFLFVACFIVGWIAVNEWAANAGWEHVDEPPFFWLQGLVSANALLLTIAVLIRQKRMSKQAERRAHLDLHINLLTEQKVSKVLAEIHAMRKSLGQSVIDEAEARELTTAADPKAMLAAIKASEDETVAPTATPTPTPTP